MNAESRCELMRRLLLTPDDDDRLRRVRVLYDKPDGRERQVKPVDEKPTQEAA